jgi:hypothetical protein
MDKTKKLSQYKRKYDSISTVTRHEIRYAIFMKMNLIPYIGHLVRNCVSMSTNPINKRSLIEEEVYDELPSTDIPDEIDYDIECKNIKSDEIIFLRNPKGVLSVCVNCLLPTLTILTLSLG